MLERQSLQQIVLGKLDSHMWNNEIRSFLNSIHKNKLKKWVEDLNLRPDTIKLLQENIGRTLSDINQNIFFNPPLRIMEIRARISKWDLLKLKSFWATKETISKMKRQPTDWKKTIANDVTVKGFIYSKIFKQLMMLISIKTNNPLKKWAKDLSRHLSKEDIRMANSHMKRCSTSLVIR